MATVRRGVVLAGSLVSMIVAVSPFESQDIALDDQNQRRSFAAVIEQYLMSQPGLAVVELAEARLLA